MRDFPEYGVFLKVFYSNLALLNLRVLLLPFIVLLQNTHTPLAENVENLITTQPRISAPSNKRPLSRSKNLISAQGG